MFEIERLSVHCIYLCKRCMEARSERSGACLGVWWLAWSDLEATRAIWGLASATGIESGRLRAHLSGSRLARVELFCAFLCVWRLARSDLGLVSACGRSLGAIWSESGRLEALSERSGAILRVLTVLAARSERCGGCLGGIWSESEHTLILENNATHY